MRTDLAFEVMERILPDIAELCDDAEVTALRDDIKAKRASTTSDIMPRLMPIFVKNHRDAVVRIIAAISGKSADEIEEQDFKLTVKDANGGMVDSIMDFFGWCLKLVLRM